MKYRLKSTLTTKLNYAKVFAEITGHYERTQIIENISMSVFLYQHQWKVIETKCTYNVDVTGQHLSDLMRWQQIYVVREFYNKVIHVPVCGNTLGNYILFCKVTSMIL